MAGGLIVSFVKLPKDSVRVIFLSGGISFLLGDFLMGAGQNVLVWSIAGIAASLPFLLLWRAECDSLPDDSAEYAGAYLCRAKCHPVLDDSDRDSPGRFLADYVFEPFMCADGGIQTVLHRLTGYGAGSGWR